ncbi:MAG: TonB-dependent receptor plug domain-containing protein, partial [Ignavibacteria bacterium]|nr:TonB-dependent receptor plug domain-containing protein [Ignavibacteria bacterium]
MKKITLTLLLLFCASFAFSQKVTVRDISSLQPVMNVVLNTGKNSVTTDVLGIADITAFDGASKIIITSSDFITQTLSYAQIKASNFTVLLTDKSYRTDEIIVSENKFKSNSRYLPRQVEVFNSEDIAYSNTQNTADLLEKSGSVFVQKSQLGGGSPVIRGFEANKVLIMVDGVRLNNLIFRGGHLQNVLRIDENVLNRAEVLFGAGSTVYGSDALGGVMSYYTKDPILSLTNKTFSTGTAFFRYSSADNENTGHFDFHVSNKKIGFLGSLTYSNFNALTMGTKNVKNQAWLRKFTADHINGKDTMIATSNYYSQDPSGYNQYDILAKVLFDQSPNVTHTFNFQYSNTNDIPRYDRLNTINSSTGNFTNAQWYYGPERRILGSYKLSLKSKDNFYDNSKILLAYQDVNESRNSRS